MSNAKKFLTAEQLAIGLNTPGCLWNQDGSPAVDQTLGSELAAYHKRFGLELLAVDAQFERVAVEADPSAEESGEESAEGGSGASNMRLVLRHFMAWTKDHVLLVQATMFGDYYLAVVPAAPTPGAKVDEVTEPSRPEEEGVKSAGAATEG